MRRNNFLIGAFVALVTYITLSAFFGHSRWGWHRGWRHSHYYYDERRNNNNWHENNRQSPHRQPATDTTEIR